MFFELSNIFRITKPKHLIHAIKSPVHALRAFKYHYRRVSERDFISFFVKQAGFSGYEIGSAYRNLNNNDALWDDIKKTLAVYPKGYGCQMTKELPLLYLLVRLTKPSHIIETGVASGASSAYILQALTDNRKGELHSIDIPPDNLPIGKTSGWVVPECLRNR